MQYIHGKPLKQYLRKKLIALKEEKLQIKTSNSSLRNHENKSKLKNKQKKNQSKNYWGKKAKKETQRASLVAQWLRICLPMQGTRVRALVWEDPTCRGVAGPVSHNY